MTHIFEEIGLSNTLAKLISGRQVSDMYVLLLCFVIVVIVIIISYFYLRPYYKSSY